MKRITLIPLALILTTLIFTSCEEDTYADWKIINDNWLEVHKTDPGFTETESGLCYKVIHQGYLRKPNSSSYVDVLYTGTYINDVVFDETKDGKVFKTNLSSTIQGWIEGITKMNVGGHYVFYIPASLAYGDKGRGSIPPHSVLQFDVTLVASEDQIQ